MSKETIPWFHPEIGIEEEEEVIRVLRSGYINDGKLARDLEDQIAKFLGVAFCTVVTSGTVALALSLMALGVKAGDEVIVPDFTFIATANAVSLTGARVKLVDIESDRLTIDVQKVEEAIHSKTKAVIAVDVNGRAPDYCSLEAICQKHGVGLICDSAEAFGSQSENRFLGTYGDVGCFSLSANKTLTSGQGGLIVTNNETLFLRLKELKDQGRLQQGSGGDDMHPSLGFNFKYTNLQAAVALAQLKKIPARLKYFSERDHWYRELLRNCPGITFPETKVGEIQQWADVLCEDRAQFVAAFKNHQIDFRNFWIPLHKQTPYLQKDEGFENAIKVSRQGLWLPSSFSLSHKEAEFVSQVMIDEVVHQRV